jgi:subtilisin-like proprotein convertase family protein
MVGPRRLRWLLMASVIAITALFLFPSTSPVQAQAPSGISPQIRNGAGNTKPDGGAAQPNLLPAQAPAFTPDVANFTNEVEPNNFYTQSNSITLPAAILGNIYQFPNAAVASESDYYSFQGTAGDTFFGAIITAFGQAGDSTMTVYAADGTTIVEEDVDNGTLAGSASSIAGTTLPTTGTYYVRIRAGSTGQATNQIRPYQLYMATASGTPTPEVEPNDTTATANPLPANGYVSGMITTTTVAAFDLYSFTANAGDTIFLDVDADPERDGTDTSLQAGIGLFNNNLLVHNDAGSAGPDAEAAFQTVRQSGTYYALVTGTGAGNLGSYRMKVTVFPAASAQACTTYAYTGPAVAIPDNGTIDIPISVPANTRIGDLNVNIDLSHALMADVDAVLISPQNNTNGLFNDVGNATTLTMTATIDDEAPYPIGTFAVMSGVVVQPENVFRLDYYDYENANGTWTLRLWDDLATNVGTLRSWSLEICAAPAAPTCDAGEIVQQVYATDFESGAAGFTHSGTLDEWELGTQNEPLSIPSCNSGTQCWGTDLDSNYENNSNQILLSPAFDLSAYAGRDIWVQWAQRHSIESANWDNYRVQAQETISPTNVTVLYDWLGPTSNSTFGPTALQNSAGWGTHYSDLSAYGGDSDVRVRYQMIGDSSVPFPGVAIDDVAVYACMPGPTPTPTNTATNTPVPPTNTPTNTATNTPVPPTNTPTNTATNTPVNTATATATNTNTPVPPTATATATTPGGSQVVTYCSTFTPLAIPDGVLTGITGTLTIPAAATILDANVRISTTHTWIGDLTFRLTNGTTSTILVDRPGRTTTGFGCSGNNIDDNFVDDEGAGGTWESSCASDPANPAYPAGARLIGGDTPITGNPTLLTAYDGASTAGTWSLNVSDAATPDTGTLNQFCMEFLVPAGGTATATATATNTPVPPTNTPTSTPTNTTVPSTNTPTATVTNTPTGPTNTPTVTATPGTSGRVCSSTVVTIPDSNPTGVTSVINVGTAGTISDLNVVLTGTHSWVGDLRFNISNGTTNVTFYDQPGVPASTFGCSGDNLPGVVGDDEGSNGSFENSCLNATPAYVPGGTYTGNSPLSAFDGATAAGNWTLTVSDLAAGDTGTLDGWCVDITTGAGPTATPTVSPTPQGQVPDINLNPSSFVETHSNAPQVTTDTLNVQNVGSGTLTWTITEDDSRPFANPNLAQPRDPNAPVARLGTAGGSTTSKLELGPIVGDGSFETGTPNASWEEFSANFGTPLCDAVCGTGGGTGPRTGAWWSWFGGTTAAETGILTQTVTIPSGSAELTFWLEIPPTATGTNGFLSVRMDGTEVFRAEETTPGYGTYAEVTVDASAYADGGSHELVFFSVTDAGAAVTNFFVDDVAITATAGGQCTAPTAIPWLTVSPLNGSTTGGGSTPVTLTYNSASLAVGTYTGTLCVASNDPDEALVTVPVTLIVEEPTAIDIGSFTSPVAGVNLADLAAAGLLLLAGAVLVLRRK